MDTLYIKIIIAVIIAIVICISGLWLNNSGKPYNTIVLTVHKLISVGTLLYIVFSCYQLNKTATFVPVELVLCISMLILFLIAIGSGAILSTDNQISSFVQIIHRISSIASFVFTGALIYLSRARL
jgi:hypothetical protein